MKNYFDFKKKTILISGSEGFLGEAIVKRISPISKRLILIDIHKKRKKNLNLKNIDYFQCDFSSNLEIENLIKKISYKYNKIDIIINNAAITTNNKKSKNLIINNFEQSIKVNLNSVYLLNMGLMKLLKKSLKPCILNLSSVYSVLGPDVQLYQNTNIKISPGYNASKAGIVNLTKWMACYFAPKIRVNAISPGGIFRKHSNKFLINYSKKTPLKRMANKDEIVNVIIFLISDMSSYMTGHNLIVDGGFSIK